MAADGLGNCEFAGRETDRRLAPYRSWVCERRGASRRFEGSEFVSGMALATGSLPSVQCLNGHPIQRSDFALHHMDHIRLMVAGGYSGMDEVEGWTTATSASA